MRLLQLIQLYFYVCEIYEQELQWHCMRHTKNQAQPKFTDPELLCSYLFSLAYERKTRVKDAYEYIKHHWADCFPELPSYQAYNARLNRLAGALPHLAAHLAARYSFANNKGRASFLLTDSMPIITCSGKRAGKVARELCDKGYNSTKKMHYFGVKLHGLGFSRSGALPVIEAVQIGAASEHDLQAQRQLLEQYAHLPIFGDKAFNDSELELICQSQGGQLMCPVKYKRGQPQEDRQRHKAADDLYSKAVSKIRQPIESFFNWLIEHTDIQRASKVRSLPGLMVHIFGRIAAALILITELN
jgi:hypothetical protein